MLIDSSDVDENSIFKTIDNQVNICNIIQNVVLSPIKNTYFPWLCLLLLVSSDNLKRPLLYFAMAHWGINTIGDILYQSIFLYKPDFPIFPFGNKIYILSIGISSVLFLTSEILGDWYLLIRTKVLIRSNKKVLIALITSCLLFNSMKVAEMIIYLRYVPFPTDQPEILNNMELLTNEYNRRFGIVIDQRLNVLIYQQVTSLIYDILVIIILKKNVFVKNEIGLSNNTFLSKFKQLSEYRIYIGVVIALIAAPFIFVEVLLLRSSQETYYNVIYTIRSKLLNFFYIFMYIDQISLRFFVERTNVVRSNYNNGNSFTNSKSSHNLNNNSGNKSSTNTLTYNMSSSSLRSLGNMNNYSNSTINYNNQQLNNYNAMNYGGQSHNNYNSNGINDYYDYNNQNMDGPNYRYNNYNVVNSFNSNSNNTSVSNIFYNKLLHQNQMENDDDRYLIDKQNHYI
ncbi:hypothetical protein H8356DRAFT_1628979 [Neocallimastix lanati (nom. inval.)]|jgi:hypothetical protein|uniref:Uncharacterized protein n=1 Tax=Neocallimastix californiae TaxID=1754190 RepID=A0A1Y2F8A9_9FUNG|nr:hypothetical protein H8356DRAFT_1628979 [Neocallimastix sp. JGI-2020a]ORY79596.1 hypothetical protein LY90DRAFT_51139 [Neocallimastix californiae]|eukprot:ORY79596.1 hypothetical protein LY90DRAFT_51139 [Neocallimastix californiae]